ncbi:MAG: hypothetical protein V1862_02840 [Methanobacteriota archaeon]
MSRHIGIVCLVIKRWELILNLKNDTPLDEIEGSFLRALLLVMILMVIWFPVSNPGL